MKTNIEHNTTVTHANKYSLILLTIYLLMSIIDSYFKLANNTFSFIKFAIAAVTFSLILVDNYQLYQKSKNFKSLLWVLFSGFIIVAILFTFFTSMFF